MSHCADLDLQRRIERAKLWAEESAKPWIAQIVRVRAWERPTYEVTPDGLKVISNGLEGYQLDLINACEQAIASIYRQAAKMAGGA